MPAFYKAAPACGVLILLGAVALAQQKPPSPKSPSSNSSGSNSPAAKTAPAKPAEPPLTTVIEQHFARWDRSHNDVLELQEVDHLIEDPSVHGRQAALVVSLRHHLTDKNNPNAISHEELLKLVAEPSFAKMVEHKTAYLKEIDRELFLTSDPNLNTFNQGRLNDCYLLSVIAAQVHRNPKVIREMIHPQVTGGFHVVFGNGQRIDCGFLTDSELLLGARLDSKHGSWLAVLEKAYGLIRKADRLRAGDKDKSGVTAGSEPIGTLDWGNSGVIISLLTGRQTETLRMHKADRPDHAHSVLVEMTSKRRLVCAGTNKDKGPPGIVSNHAYAILGYDAFQRHVTIFNPWGNTFTPKGVPGIDHGYATKNGVFIIPLDQFHVVFSEIVYETDRHAKK